ncbi:hypothetical protein [Streptomyces sp. NPDC059786]|uniref:hypothetical protein n=1 Tax=Streptomyces sp. NPDC059786 TaxID=3346946 RepID=UPI00365F4BE6
MHGPGPGYPPPPPKRPSTGVLVVLRVLFGALPLLSIGFLAWVSPLRVALVTHRRTDWWLFVLSLVVLGISFGFLSTDDTDDFSTTNGNIGMGILLLNAALCTAWFLFADIRHYSRPGYPGHPGRTGYIPARPPAVSPYAYTQPSAPAAPYPAVHPQPPAHPQMPQNTAPHTPVPHTPAPHTPVPQQPQRPAPARIDQVRAELDELSDYLRNHDGGHGDTR